MDMLMNIKPWKNNQKKHPGSMKHSVFIVTWASNGLY